VAAVAGAVAVSAVVVSVDADSVGPAR
jgi:hypothetical protein